MISQSAFFLSKKERDRILKLIRRVVYYFIWQFIFLNSLLAGSVSANESCLTNKQQLARVTDWAIVATVVDGDTIYLKDGRKIRVIGINTPEIGRRGKPSEPFARQAHKTLRRLLTRNKKIGLTYDLDKKDRYKRTLAYVNLEDGRSAAQILLAKGLAYSIVVPPNDARIDCYRAIEHGAQNSHSGIWQLPDNQWLDAYSLPEKSKGLRFVRGVISHYSEGRKSIYLKLTPELSIRIAKKDKQYFPDLNFKTLSGKSVSVRGWVSTYKGRQSIHIRSEHDLEF